MKINKSIIATIPGILISAFPVVTCIPCSVAYIGLLSALGLGFTLSTPILLPLMIIFLGMSLISFWWTAKKTGSYRVFVLSIFAVLLILLGKFYLTSNTILYTGIMVLIFASLLNIRRKKVCDINKKHKQEQQIQKKDVNGRLAILTIISILLLIIVSIFLREKLNVGIHDTTDGHLHQKMDGHLHQKMELEHDHSSHKH
jgi:diacylglycerol kinase